MWIQKVDNHHYMNEKIRKKDQRVVDMHQVARVCIIRQVLDKNLIEFVLHPHHLVPLIRFSK